MNEPLTDGQIWGEPITMAGEPEYPHKCPIRDCICPYWVEDECLADVCVLEPAPPKGANLERSS